MNAQESENFENKLTPAEEEVCRLVAQGLENKEIAFQLRKNAKTVANQMTSIMQKLGVSSRGELVLTRGEIKTEYYLGLILSEELKLSNSERVAFEALIDGLEPRVGRDIALRSDTSPSRIANRFHGVGNRFRLVTGRDMTLVDKFGISLACQEISNRKQT